MPAQKRSRSRSSTSSRVSKRRRTLSPDSLSALRLDFAARGEAAFEAYPEFSLSFLNQMVDQPSDDFPSEDEALAEDGAPPQREASLGSLGQRMASTHITSPSRPASGASSFGDIPPIPDNNTEPNQLQPVPEGKDGSDGERVDVDTGVRDPYQDKPKRRRKQTRPRRKSNPKSRAKKTDRAAMPPPNITHKTIPKGSLPPPTSNPPQAIQPKPIYLNTNRRYGTRLFHPSLKPRIPKWGFVEQYPNETANGLAFSGPLCPHDYRISETGKSAVFAFLFADDSTPQTSTPISPQATSFLKSLHGPLTYRNIALDAGDASPMRTHPAFDAKNWYATNQRQRILMTKPNVDLQKLGWSKRRNEFTRAETRLTQEASMLTHCPYNNVDVRTIHLTELLNGGMLMASRQLLQLSRFSADGAVPFGIFHDGKSRAGIREGPDGPFTSLDLPKSAMVFFFSVDPLAQIGILLQPLRTRPRGHCCHAHLVILGNAKTKKTKPQADYYGDKKDGIHAVSAADASQFLS